MGFGFGGRWWVVVVSSSSCCCFASVVKKISVPLVNKLLPPLVSRHRYKYLLHRRRKPGCLPGFSFFHQLGFGCMAHSHHPPAIFRDKNSVYHRPVTILAVPSRFVDDRSLLM